MNIRIFTFYNTKNYVCPCNGFFFRNSVGSVGLVRSHEVRRDRTTSATAGIRGDVEMQIRTKRGRGGGSAFGPQSAIADAGLVPDAARRGGIIAELRVFVGRVDARRPPNLHLTRRRIKMLRVEGTFPRRKDAAAAPSTSAPDERRRRDGPAQSGFAF